MSKQVWRKISPESGYKSKLVYQCLYCDEHSEEEEWIQNHVMTEHLKELPYREEKI